MSNKTRPRHPAARNVRPVAPPARRVAALVIAFALGALLAGPIAAVTAGGSPADGDPAGVPADDPVAALRAQEAERNAAQIVELTSLARREQESLVPVLEGLATALPAGQPPGPAATQSDVESWQVVTAAVVGNFANPPSGGTGVNIARSGLAAAVRALDAAVDTYAAALAQPPAARTTLLELAGRQRDIAVATWSTAATQLDVLNIEAGNGHVHVFLPAAPGQGALTPDGAPEGE
ncbi:hypothetical protein [Micromonospora sp. NBC_01813]|uniref:hypothetical protein n=1 Tax=Micromonospora sp. NBC_01813 TaxID=2975988 RepID=UPI002DD999A3|nr:hypothetical protein [Micromonospora sp. NBC_01813]WSA10198.1 hypothetical protein OG958_05215 [Micromonospora sp. NBC_01813]